MQFNTGSRKIQAMRYLLTTRVVWKIGKILKFCQNITLEAMVLFYYDILDSLHDESNFSCKDLRKGIGQKNPDIAAAHVSKILYFCETVNLMDLEQLLWEKTLS